MTTDKASGTLKPWRDRLEEEIRYLEGRLKEIGFEGDCAYERAMSRFFREQIDSRRERIAGGEAVWTIERPETGYRKTPLVAERNG